MWKQLVQPDLSVKEAAGNCLIFSRKVFGAPAGIPSAREGWDFTKFKHADRNLPNVSVPVWFDHIGTYGKPPERKNWGHVAVYIPGRGVLSSPTSGFGQRWFTSIEQLEKVMPAKYIGWSEDINGKRVVINQGGEDMPITKEMEMTCSLMATGAYPGRDYNYKFTGTTDYNGMLTFWATQISRITKEVEQVAAQGSTGGNPGKDYSYPFVGKEWASYGNDLVKFWASQRQDSASGQLLKPGNYTVK